MAHDESYAQILGPCMFLETLCTLHTKKSISPVLTFIELTAAPTCMYIGLFHILATS